MKQTSRDRVAPYSSIARFYDRVMGYAQFLPVKKAFERRSRELHMQFRTAADLACGTGLFLRFLAGPGRRVFGVDSSPEMLRVAARRTRGQGVRLLCQDMRTLQLPAHVDLITCNNDSLNYLLSPEAFFRVLRRCQLNLRPGGYLIFDLITGGSGRKPWPVVVQQFAAPGVVSTWRIYVDGRRGVSVVVMQSLLRRPDGEAKRVKELHVQRWYSTPLVRLLLGESGLTLCGAYDMDSQRRADNNSFRVQFVAMNP